MQKYFKKNIEKTIKNFQIHHVIYVWFSAEKNEKKKQKKPKTKKITKSKNKIKEN